ncbi:MAG: AhpC/TSA family protein [Parabacteroides distasonis]|nr:AhpC/TSA family protein [Parabacteroides distasonis]
MKKYLSIIASALLLVACSEKPGYVISGTVSDTDSNGKYVYLYQAPFKGSQGAIDSALVENNTFTFTGTADTAKACVIVLPKEGARPQAIDFILENAPLTATFNETASTVVGSPANDNLVAFFQQLKELHESGKTIAEELKSEDKAIAEAAKEKEEAFEKQLNDLYKNFINQNLNSLSGAIVLVQRYHSLSDNDLIQITDNMGEIFKTHPTVERIKQIADVRKTVLVGNKFVDFEMADTEGKMHKLSEYVGNGKVVLIDFWASWCPPCRASMPSLVALHKTYKNKGFNIIGISLDRNAEAWVKGIKDLKITWPQLSDVKGWQNAGAALYGVNSIPHTVLVSKDGTILAKNLHGQELEEKIKEALK